MITATASPRAALLAAMSSPGFAVNAGLSSGPAVAAVAQARIRSTHHRAIRARTLTTFSHPLEGFSGLDQLELVGPAAGQLEQVTRRHDPDSSDLDAATVQIQGDRFR